MKIIEVKGIEKKYKITHQRGGYVSLRDVIADTFKNPFHFLKSKAKKMMGKETKEIFYALKDINFSIERGEVVGIIGKNGAGKSTLLKILSKITTPTKGEIRIVGTVGSLLEVGTGFHPELTGRENIFLNGAILGIKKKEIEKKFDDIVEFAEIEQFLDTPVKYYSSGMYVRLAFSVAAHMNTDILIIDEVLAVGDAEFQKKCLGKMEEITHNEGRTILFVSHNLSTVQNLCQRCILLENGRMEFIGETNECISRYVHKNGISGQVEWKDYNKIPGNEEVKIRSVRILSEGKVTSQPPINKDIVLEITYENLKEGNIFGNSMHLRDESGAFLFVAMNTPIINGPKKDEWYDRKRSKGIYVSYCVIPSNLLNDKTYFIDVGIINKHAYHQFLLTNILSFTCVQSKEARKEYGSDWIGTIHPQLEWKTEFRQQLEVAYKT